MEKIARELKATPGRYEVLAWKKHCDVRKKLISNEGFSRTLSVQAMPDRLVSKTRDTCYLFKGDG